ncbi:MAG: hypothetical protein GJ677_14350 [Rhodobacteraceae bacterium]|nr:hypothetical protein [Paracoccaceae bacterium]
MPKASFEEKKIFEQTEIDQVVLPATFGLADDLDLDVVLLGDELRQEFIPIGSDFTTTI